jgi:cytoskeletal protein RodZ
MKSAQQLMLSIGALLASEREKRGIPVEKAAKETRMRAQRIRDMEADDLSQFTNPSYARMFIIAYAKYLGISMKTILEHLPDRGEPGTDGYQYTSSPPEELPALRRNLVSRPLHRSLWLPILGLAAFLLIAAAGIIGTYIYVNVNRITAAVDKPPPTPEPTPQIIIVQPPPPEVHLSNLPADGQKPTWLEGSADFTAPPSPSPVPAVMEKPALPAASPVVVTTASPAPTQAGDDDRAFLLGTTPEQKPSSGQ